MNDFTSNFRSTLHTLFDSRSQSLVDLSGSFSARACVAAILRGDSFANLDLAYIRRAQADGDRWSGQVAFPGGKWESGDEDNLATAIREVQEEVGITLHRSDCIGRLNDIRSRSRASLLDFYVRPYVFWIAHEVHPQLNLTEAADFFWVPMHQLKNKKSQREYEWTLDGTSTKMPAIAMPGEPPLWGLTHLMTLDLLSRLEELSGA